MYDSVASTTFMCFSDRKFTTETRGLKVKKGCFFAVCAASVIQWIFMILIYLFILKFTFM